MYSKNLVTEGMSEIKFDNLSAAKSVFGDDAMLNAYSRSGNVRMGYLTLDAFFHEEGFSEAFIEEIKPLTRNGAFGRIVGGTFSYGVSKATLEQDDETDFSGTELSSINEADRFVLKIESEGKWTEDWIQSLPTIQYGEDESKETFDRPTSAISKENVEEYLNKFGIYPDEANFLDTDNKTVDLLASKERGKAIKLSNIREIEVYKDTQITAALHDIGTPADVTFVGDGALTLYNDNREFSGTMRLNVDTIFNSVFYSVSPVLYRTWLPSGTVIVDNNKTLTVLNQGGGDANINGTIIVEKGSKLSLASTGAGALQIYGKIILR